jgi:hypothetical protein
MRNRTVIRTVITPRTITRRVGPAGAGGGATTFAALTDKATADLPVINGPLASALSGKQPLDADLTSWALIARAAGFDTFTGTPSSANLRALVTDETGTGALVFGTGPTLVGFTNTGAITFSTGTTFTYSLGIAAAHRTALGLGSLATQSGTFSGSFSGTHSGNSSGFNTGDQDLSGLVPKLSTLIVTGIADSGMGSALILTMVEQSSLVNGRRSWLGSGATLFHDPGTGAWRLEYSDIDVFYVASIVDDSQEPWKLTGWTEEQGSGQPNFSLTPNVLLPVQSSSGTLALTQSLNGEPDKLTNGYIRGSTTVDDDVTWNYGTGSAEAHRIALGGTADGSTGAALFGAATPAAGRAALGVIRRVLGSDALATSTTPVAAPDLTFPVEAGKVYRVDLSLFVASLAGASPGNPGYQVSMTYPTMSRTGFGNGLMTHPTTPKIINLGATSTTLNPNTTGNPNGTAGVSGYAYLRPTVSGNVTFASYHQTAAQTGTVGLLAGSLVTVTEL